MKHYFAGAWRDVTSGKVRIGGVWRTITSAQAYTDDAWREVASFVGPLSVAIDPSDVGGFVVGEGTVITRAVNAVATGGAAPFTYSWTRIGFGDGVADSPSSASTRFSRFVARGQVAEETFRVTVTSAGQTATADIPVSFISVDLGL